MNILAKSYTEDGYKRVPYLRLSDEDYGQALRCFVPAATDIVIIDSAKEEIYLARRKARPMRGWWWMGGRMATDDTTEAAAARNFKRETGPTLPQERFQLRAILDYRWKDREQEPIDIGCHMAGFTFAVELTPEELATVAANMDEEEYVKTAGLVSFNREMLVGHGDHRPLRPPLPAL